MMNYQDLMLKALEVIREPDESAIERLLQTMAELPEPEDALEASLRGLIVDMAVAEYLGTCDCLHKEER
jgi:translation elongation factor EF-4